MSSDLKIRINADLPPPHQTRLAMLPLLHIVDQGLGSAAKLLPLIQFESLSREDTLELTATIHAAMSELETASMRLRPILNQIEPLNTAKH